MDVTGQHFFKPSSATATQAPANASESRTQLPSELIYHIFVLRISEYARQTVFSFNSEPAGDQLRPLLHTCRRFRYIAIDIISYILEESLVDRNSFKLQNFLPFFRTMQNHVHRTRTALPTSLASVLTELVIFDTTGRESLLKSLAVAYTTRLAGRRLLEESPFDFRLHLLDFIVSVPECQTPEPILRCFVEPLLRDIYTQELYVRRLWALQHLRAKASGVLRWILRSPIASNQAAAVEYLEKMKQETIASCTDHRQALEHVQRYLRTSVAAQSAALHDIAPISSATLHSTGIVHLIHIVDEKKRTSDDTTLRSYCEVVAEEMEKFLTPEELLSVESSKYL